MVNDIMIERIHLVDCDLFHKLLYDRNSKSENIWNEK